MATQRSMIHPTNKIVLDSQNLHIQTMKVENGTLTYPGCLVKKGTSDDDVVVATAGSDAFGWLGYEQTTKKWRPATVDEIYLIHAQVAVINGPGIVLVAHLAASQTVTKGERLVATADGELAAATALVIPSGTVAVLSSGAQPAITGAFGSEQIVVAIAEESVTTTGAAADILVRSLI